MERDRHTDGEGLRDEGREANKQIYMHTDRHISKQTCRYAYIHTGRPTYMQAPLQKQLR